MKKPVLGKRSLLLKDTKREYSVDFGKENDFDQNPLYTGRYLVILKDPSRSFVEAKSFFETRLGFTVADTRDFLTEAVDEQRIQYADALIYEELGIALVSCEEDQLQILDSAEADFIIKPEKVVYIPKDVAEEIDTPSTWGIDVTQALISRFTGKDIKVAVLDTGFDTLHPDFSSRNVITNSFVPEETIQDVHGHGTHCIGTACGSTDINGLRYGVASDSLIYAGKVLSNQGSGAQSWILNGMTWAANHGCKVISMSLGSMVFPGEGYDMAYERAAQFALSKGAVVVAAAGNDSSRNQNQFQPVASPADCPSIVAVAALDSTMNVADFSNRAINPTGLVDIAAPGVAVYSSWVLPTRYRSISGTSMAAPHVAGILALLWEQSPTATPDEIINQLQNIAKGLPLPNIDIGVGLSIAP